MEKLKCLLMGLVLLNISCGSKNENSVATVASAYYLSNGTCYSTSSNAAVDASNCSGVTYFLSNGACYSQTTQQSVDITLCTALVNQYYWSGGVCRDKNNANQSVATTYCSSSGTQYAVNSSGNCVDQNTGIIVSGTYCNATSGQYYWNGSLCFNSQTQTQVNAVYCSTNSNTSSCYGLYTYVNYYGYLDYVQCSGSNCRGFGLYEANTGRYVICQ